MKNRLKKLNLIKKKTFTAKEAKSFDLDYYDLNTLVKNEKLRKSARGVYQKTSFKSYEEESLLNALAHLGDQSCICLLSAFYYYGITDEIPDQVWVYVPINKFSHLNNLKVVRKRDPRWEIGIIKKNGVVITNIHRTVIDALSDKKHVTDPESMKIVKAALDQKLTTLKELVSMAKKLDVYNRVKLKLTLLQDEYV